jgi:hypothetical protein
MTTESQLENIVNIITKYPLVSYKTVLNNNITEKNIMSLLFSNSFVSSDNSIIEYILKERKSSIGQNILKQTIFYDNNFQIYRQQPIQNNYISDLDISFINSENIKKYYFLLDVLSQIYNNFTKLSSNNILIIKSRYYIDDNDTVSLYKKSKYYTFNIKYQINEKDVKFVLDNVEAGIDKNMVELMIQPIANDIQKHLTYIHMSDINYKNYDYFKNIEFFYKFCRLKLKYYTLLCFSELNPNINNYIDSILKYCFINLKNSMNVYTDGSALLLTNTLSKTKDDVKNINDMINNKKQLIKRNYNNSKKWDSKYFYTILYITIIISIIVLIISTLINKIEFKIFSKIYIDIGIILFIIATYTSIFHFININTLESFNTLNDLELEKSFLLKYNKGLRFKTYNEYFNNTSWFIDKSPSKIGITNNISSISNGTINIIRDNSTNVHSVEWNGYFYVNTDGNWTFYIRSNNISYIWLGDIALIGYNRDNALVKNEDTQSIITEKSGTINLVKNRFYPIRIQFGKKSDNNIVISWKPPNSDMTSNGDGYFYLDTPNGLQFKIYNGYFNDDVSFFNKNNSINSGIVTDISNIYNGTNGLIPLNNSLNRYSVEWNGFFYATDTGEWTFYSVSDDASYIWIGEIAKSGYVRNNAIVNNGGLHGMQERSGKINLIKDTYYPIRIQFGENSGSDNISISWNRPGNSTRIYNGNGFFFESNTAIQYHNIIKKPQQLPSAISDNIINLIKYPQNPMRSNNTIINNIQTRCKASSRTSNWGDVFVLFNHNKNDEGTISYHSNYRYINGIATDTYFTNYKGEFIMIDLGLTIILKQIGITSRGGFLNRCPGIFRIYATNDINKFDNNDYNGWNLIYDQTTRLSDYEVNKTKMINIQNNISYQIYALTVNTLSGNDTILNFSEWELFGIPSNIQEPSISSQISQGVNTPMQEIPIFTPELPIISSELYTSSFENILQDSQQAISLNQSDEIQRSSDELLRTLTELNTSEENITINTNIETQNANYISELEQQLKDLKKTTQSVEFFTNYDKQILLLQNDINKRKKVDVEYYKKTENAVLKFNTNSLKFIKSKIDFTKTEITSEFNQVYNIFDDLNSLKNEINNALSKFDDLNDINIIEVDRLNNAIRSIYEKNQIDISLIIKKLQNLFDRLLKERREFAIFQLAFLINNIMKQTSMIKNKKNNILNENINNLTETFISSEVSTILSDERKIKKELQNIIDQSNDKINNAINEIYTQHINEILLYLERINSIEINTNKEFLQIPNIVESIIKNIYPPLKNPVSIVPINNNNNAIDVVFDNKKYRVFASSSLNRNNYVSNLIDQDLTTSWSSRRNNYNPEYNGNTLLKNTKTKGEWIVYSMPESFNLEELTITSINNKPRTWEVYGNTGNNNNWIFINDASQLIPITESNYQNNIYTKSFDKKEAYRNYAIIITSIIQSTNNINKNCSISDIRFKGNVSWLEKSTNLKNQVLNLKKELLRNMLMLIINIKNLKIYIEKLINISKKSFNPELELLQKSYELYIKFTNKQEYKYYKEDESNITTTITNIDKSLTENIQNIAVLIANNIIISALKKEDYDMKRQKDFVNVLEYKSTSDVHVTKHTNKFLIYTSYLILRVVLFTCLLNVINRYLNMNDLYYYILIIGYIIIILLYIIDIIKNVRTKSNNIYWGKPSILSSDM